MFLDKTLHIKKSNHTIIVGKLKIIFATYISFCLALNLGILIDCFTKQDKLSQKIGVRRSVKGSSRDIRVRVMEIILIFESSVQPLVCV